MIWITLLRVQGTLDSREVGNDTSSWNLRHHAGADHTGKRECITNQPQYGGRRGLTNNTWWTLHRSARGHGCDN